jgi:hypothetical protein
MKATLNDGTSFKVVGYDSQGATIVQGNNVLKLVEWDSVKIFIDEYGQEQKFETKQSMKVTLKESEQRYKALSFNLLGVMLATKSGNPEFVPWEKIEKLIDEDGTEIVRPTAPEPMP